MVTAHVAVLSSDVHIALRISNVNESSFLRPTYIPTGRTNPRFVRSFAGSTVTTLPVMDTGQTDGHLVEQVALGSTEALEVLYGRFSRVVLSFAIRMMGDRESSEEILQEAFVRVWRQAGSYSAQKGTFVTWILSITHNLAIDAIRKRQRRPQRADAADPVLILQNVADTGPGIDLQAEHGELRELVRTALNELPDAQRNAIVMAYFRGMTQREIAEELGEPLGTIKTRMRLGMFKLRDALERNKVELP